MKFSCVPFCAEILTVFFFNNFFVRNSIYKLLVATCCEKNYSNIVRVILGSISSTQISF